MTPKDDHPKTLQLYLGNRTLTTPVIGDQETTRKAAELVNRALSDIEAGADRVDTQVFALRAALQFAAENLRLEYERSQETRELVKALDSIGTALRQLVEELAPEA